MQDYNRYKIKTENADWQGICEMNGIRFDSFGTRKELEALPEYLEPGEVVFALASGFMKQTITSNTFDGGLQWKAFQRVTRRQALTLQPATRRLS